MHRRQYTRVFASSRAPPKIDDGSECATYPARLTGIMKHKLEYADLARALKAVTPFASKDTTRRRLCCVSIILTRREADSTIEVIATDGHRLAWWGDTCGYDGPNAHLVLDVDAANALSKAAKKQSMIAVGIDDDAPASIACANSMFTTIEVQTPPYHLAIPRAQSSAALIAFAAPYLAGAANAFATVTRVPVPIRVEAIDDVMGIITSPSVPQLLIVIMSYRTDATLVAPEMRAIVPAKAAAT
jgi:hypothetical protein